MKSLRICLALACSFLAVDAFAADIQQHVTPDGHVFHHFDMPEAERGTVVINWPAGLSEMDPDKAVTPRIAVNVMLNGGAGDRSADDLKADFEDLDAGSELRVQPDQVRGLILAPQDTWAEAAGIANDVIARPKMEQSTFLRERERMLDNSKGRINFIWGNAWTLARDIMLADHVTRNYWSLLPHDGIQAVTLDDVKAWRAAAMTTHGIEITSAGDASPEIVAKAIDTALSGLSDNAPPAIVPMPEMNFPGVTILYHAPEAEKSLIMVLGELPTGSEGKDFALNLGIGILGYGKQSRLFKAVRTSLRAAYRYGAWYDAFTRSRRIMAFGGEVDTELLAEALKQTEETYEEFRQEGVSWLEYQFGKRFYRDRLATSLTKSEEVAYLMMEARLDGLSDNHVPTIIEQLDDIERSDVNKFIAQEMPPFSQMLRIVVSPDPQAIAGACVIKNYNEWASCLE